VQRRRRAPASRRQKHLVIAAAAAARQERRALTPRALRPPTYLYARGKARLAEPAPPSSQRKSDDGKTSPWASPGPPTTTGGRRRRAVCAGHDGVAYCLRSRSCAARTTARFSCDLVAVDLRRPAQQRTPCATPTRRISEIGSAARHQSAFALFRFRRSLQ